MPGNEARAFYECSRIMFAADGLPSEFTLHAKKRTGRLVLSVCSADRKRRTVTKLINSDKPLTTVPLFGLRVIRPPRSTTARKRRVEFFLESLKVMLHYETHFPVSVALNDYSKTFIASFSSADQDDALTVIINKSNGTVQPMFRM